MPSLRRNKPGVNSRQSTPIIRSLSCPDSVRDGKQTPMYGASRIMCVIYTCCMSGDTGIIMQPLRCMLQLMSAPNSFGAAQARYACAQCTPVSCSAVKASCSVRTLIMFQHSRTELQTMHLSNGRPNEKQLFEPLHNAWERVTHVLVAALDRWCDGQFFNTTGSFTLDRSYMNTSHKRRMAIAFNGFVSKSAMLHSVGTCVNLTSPRRA